MDKKYRNRKIFEVIAEVYSDMILLRDLQIKLGSDFTLNEIDKSLFELLKARSIDIKIDKHNIVYLKANKTGLERIENIRLISDFGRKIIDLIKLYENDDIRGVHRHYIAHVLNIYFSEKPVEYRKLINELSWLALNNYIKDVNGWLHLIQ